MESYVSLLRGINVSGQKKIKMADLKVYFEELGHTDVQTYIQSGNVVFKSTSGDMITLTEQIEEKIVQVYGFEVRCCILKLADLDKVLLENPFDEGAGYENVKVYFVFLIDQPSPENIRKLKTFEFSPEEYSLHEKCIYFYAPNGYGRAKMNNNFFENRLKITATTRNLKTVIALRNMMLSE